MGPDMIIVNHIFDTYFSERMEAGSGVMGWFKDNYASLWNTEKNLPALEKSRADVLQLLKIAREQETLQARAAKYVEIVLELGDKANKSQVLSSSSSVFSESLHAVRAFILKDLMETQIGRNAILQKIDELRADYVMQSAHRSRTANNGPDRDAEVIRVTEARYDDLRKLAYLGQIEAGLTDNMDVIFKGLKKPAAQYNTKKLAFYSGTLDASLPYVLHQGYETLYPNRNLLEKGGSVSQGITFADFVKKCHAAYTLRYGDEYLRPHLELRAAIKAADRAADAGVEPYKPQSNALEKGTPVYMPDSAPESPTSMLGDETTPTLISNGSMVMSAEEPDSPTLAEQAAMKASRAAAAAPPAPAPKTSIFSTLSLLASKATAAPASTEQKKSPAYSTRFRKGSND